MKKIINIILGLSLVFSPMGVIGKSERGKDYMGVRHTMIPMSETKASTIAPTGTILGDIKFLFTVEYFRFFNSTRDYIKLTNFDDQPFVLSHAEYVLKGKRIQSKKVKDKSVGGEREKTPTKTQAKYCILIVDELLSTGTKTDRGYVVNPREYLILKPFKCTLAIDYLSFTDKDGFLYYYD